MIDIPVRLADGRQIGAIEITCIKGTGRQPDSINTYEATILHYATGPASRYCDSIPPSTQNVTVTHRFGDDWTVLLTKILEAAKVRHG